MSCNYAVLFVLVISTITKTMFSFIILIETITWNVLFICVDIFPIEWHFNGSWWEVSNLENNDNKTQSVFDYFYNLTSAFLLDKIIYLWVFYDGYYLCEINHQFCSFIFKIQRKMRNHIAFSRIILWRTSKLWASVCNVTISPLDERRTLRNPYSSIPTIVTFSCHLSTKTSWFL